MIYIHKTLVGYKFATFCGLCLKQKEFHSKNWQKVTCKKCLKLRKLALPELAICNRCGWKEFEVLEVKL